MYYSVCSLKVIMMVSDDSWHGLVSCIYFPRVRRDRWLHRWPSLTAVNTLLVDSPWGAWVDDSLIESHTSADRQLATGKAAVDVPCRI